MASCTTPRMESSPGKILDDKTNDHEMAKEEDKLQLSSFSDGHQDNNIKTFELFPKLPFDVRYQIIKTAFQPRRVLVDSDNRSRLGLRSCAALLLVNKEFRRVFLSYYTRITGSLAYINYSIDTVCISVIKLRSIQNLLSTKGVNAVRYMDVRPHPIPPWHRSKSRYPNDFDPRLFTSIKLITVRSFRKAPTNDRDPMWGRKLSVRSISVIFTLERIKRTWDKFERQGSITRPIIATLVGDEELWNRHHCGSEDCLAKWRDYALINPSRITFDWKEVSPTIVNMFNIDRPSYYDLPIRLELSGKRYFMKEIKAIEQPAQTATSYQLET